MFVTLIRKDGIDNGEQEEEIAKSVSINTKLVQCVEEMEESIVIHFQGGNPICLFNYFDDYFVKGYVPKPREEESGFETSLRNIGLVK